MLTRAAAESLGWSFLISGTTGKAQKQETVFEVESAIPLFALLASIAQKEGQPFAAGWGGTTPVDSSLILSCSGETYDDTADKAAAAAAATAQQQQQQQQSNQSTIDGALQTRLDQLRQARSALAAGTLFAALGTNEKKTIDALLQDDIQICRLLLGLLDGTA